jgi:oligoendopeptidase F
MLKPMSNVAPLPLVWDLESFFPSLDSPTFREATQRLDELIETFSQALAGAESSGDTEGLERVLGIGNEIGDAMELIGSYLMCLVTTNSKDEAAQSALSEFEMRLIPFEKAKTRLTAWVGRLDLERALEGSGYLREHRFALNKMQTAARHLMSPAEEELANELAPSGPLGWEKLHSNMTSQLSVTVDLPDGRRQMPMSAVRNLAYEGERAVRAAAYEAELQAWSEAEVPIAAALNGLKGTVNVLAQRRGWDSPLDEALFRANIDAQALDAMMTAAREAFPDFRRYLRAKSRALGLESLAFHDLFAPIGTRGRSWSYAEGAAFVERQFRSYSDKLADFASRSFKEAWVDVEPKPGKVDGAYCTGMRGDESRVLMNFKPSFGSVSTLAHELGHAYHNLCLAGRPALQRETPMTLAETASIFCETIVRKSALAEVDDEERLTILEASLQGACQVVVDISSRFLFEQAVFRGRRARDLSPSEICFEMAAAQKETYGDGLDENRLHPYMWAAKPHYYSTYSFYNFPYMFGLLFALGLYAVYEREPDGFQERYDALLAATGQDDAATLAGTFGIDIRTPEFWRGSLATIREDIDAFEQLV